MSATEAMRDRSSTAQATLLTFLLDPRSYPHRPKRARLIQTHTSYVILVSPYVYKVKKPVNFGFLDFSTLEQRRHFSEREVALNRRLCPRIYLGVVPISLHAGQLTLGPGDEVVEYAIKMRKLSERNFLKRRLERGALDAHDMQRIALKLVAFYAEQTATDQIARCGQVQQLKLVTDENFAQTEAYVDLTLSQPAFEAIRLYTNRFYDQHTALFESRVTEGRIKDGHGDLHLEHIHLSPQSVCIYDCIEFNDRYRCVDVANDVAFLAMDLDYNDRPDLARSFVTQMIEVLNDATMLRLMDFYKCWRAYVRGKVESFRSSEAEVPEQERRMSQERAQRYFRLALRYAVSGSEPMVLVVMGGIGTGKSKLARRLADELDWQLLSSDRLRKELAGLPLYERSDAAMRDQLYSASAKAHMYDVLFQRAIQHIQAGASLILDATFSRRAERDRLREQLAQAGVTHVFIETQAAAETVKQRLIRRVEKTAVVSDARIEDFDKLAHAYAPPHELSDQQLLQIMTEGPPEETITETLKGLAVMHVRRS